MKFYNREKELTLLDKTEQLSHKQAQMTFVVGRRRIGKTSLLVKATENKVVLYFFVAKKSEVLLCSEFVEQIKQKLQVPLFGEIKTFKEVFGFLMELSKTRAFTLIIDEFQEKFPQKIKAFSKKNGGLSDARNFGIERASGNFLAFVDSDDYISENMLQEMYDLAIKNEAELVICNLQKVDEHGNVTQKLTQIPNFSEKIELEKNFSVFSDLSYFACNKIFKRELFDGKRFQKGMHFEDIELIPQILLQCKILAKTDAFHYQYLERSNSISKSHTERGLDILKAVKNVEIAFENSEYSHKKTELKNFQILEGDRKSVV